MAVDCGEGVIVGGELELGVEGGMDWFCSSRADGGLPNGLVTTIGGTEIGSSLASPLRNRVECSAPCHCGWVGSSTPLRGGEEWSGVEYPLPLWDEWAHCHIY